jgi:hypothetical protein
MGEDMATFYFHEETCPVNHDEARLVRYYYDNISAEILTRSFRLFSATGRKEFVDTNRIPLADLRADLKSRLTRDLCRRANAIPEETT